MGYLNIQTKICGGGKRKYILLHWGGKRKGRFWRKSRSPIT